MSRPFLRAVLLRASLLWFAFRFAMAFLQVVHFTPLGVLFLAGAVAAAVLADAHLRHEDLLLADLGYSRWPVGVLAGGWALLLEVAATATLAGLG